MPKGPWLSWLERLDGIEEIVGSNPTGSTMAKHIFLTGLRPTAEALHLGNYLGAIRDVLTIQEKGDPFFLFVADLHGLTTEDPQKVAANREKILLTYLAAGVDPQKTIIYYQSALAEKTLLLEIFLSRFFSVAQALRVPTLKEKVRQPRRASLFLLRYPTLMAADILIQRATHIPVGKDQDAHLEVSQLLARQFNRHFGHLFSIPHPYHTRGVKIMALDGQGKMSKSRPQGAIFLNDSPVQAQQKIRRAVTETLTRPPKKMGDEIASLFLLGASFANKQEKEQLANMRQEYFQGTLQFVHLKEIVSQVVGRFLVDFQQRYQAWQKKPKAVAAILEEGNRKAKKHAQETWRLVAKKTGFTLPLD